ncbi:MAG: tetratricopeptide repeat protein [Bacteroidales bacterium]|nr:tetratricopeptide repeat protein [Bacteroidales bacterium]
MAETNGRFNKFLLELKHRRVLRLITVYVAVAFGLLELIDIISGPLNLPGWVLTFVMSLSVLVLPIAVILSWIFIVTPDGIKRYRNEFSKTSLNLYQDNSPMHFGQVAKTSLSDDFVVDKNYLPNTSLANKSNKRKERIFGVSSLLVIIAVVLLFLFYSGRSVPFKERDWVVLADFENLTEEVIFDKSLNTAFSISINQSRYINVFSRRRIKETLKRMEKDGQEVIDEEISREIAMREGIKVYIIPEISKVGHQYILSGKIQETETGSVYRSELLYAENQDEIIEKLDQLSKRIRRHLGESRYKISGQSKPLIKVTTASLDALKEFSLGIENHLNLKFEEALIHYENAIRIDSNFTAAKASLGNILFERFDRRKGKEWLDEAILSIDNLTEREKYGILAFYAVNIENDLNKGIEYTNMRIELYPDDPVPHNNLGWYYQNQRQYEKAVSEYKAALRIDPHMMLTYGGVIWVYLGIGQMDSALVWSNTMISYGPDNPWGYFYLGSTYFGMDEFENAEAAYLKAMDLYPGFSLNQYRLAHIYRLQGKHARAIEVLKDILQNNPDEVSAHYDMGVNYQLMGNTESARDHFLEFKKYAEQQMMNFPEDPETYIALGTVLTRLGEKEAGWSIGKRAIEIDSTLHFKYAELLAVQDKKAEALKHLELSLENGYRALVWIKLNPDINLLKNEEGYNELIKKYFK